MTTISEEILAAARGRLEQARQWKEQIANAGELRDAGWVCSAPGPLLTGLAAFALSGAEQELAAEVERQREAAEQAAIAEAQRIDRVHFLKVGMSRADWEAKVAEKSPK
jgi:hypothetical protein